jgi:hypothetical protein
MPKARARIDLREIRAMPPQSTIFDGGTGSVPGFGARRRAGPMVSYFIMYRTQDNRQRRFTIGTHGAPRTPTTARTKAQQVLMAAKIEGEYPQAEKKAKRAAATVGELCDMYLEDAEAGRLLTRRGIAKKASTLATYRGRVETHIRPLTGTMKMLSVTREDVESFRHKIAEGATKKRETSGRKRGVSHVRGGKGTASRTVGLLSAIFTYAQRKRMISDHPVRGVIRYADRRLRHCPFRAVTPSVGAGPDRCCVVPCALERTSVPRPFRACDRSRGQPGFKMARPLPRTAVLAAPVALSSRLSTLKSLQARGFGRRATASSNRSARRAAAICRRLLATAWQSPDERGAAPGLHHSLPAQRQGSIGRFIAWARASPSASWTSPTQTLAAQPAVNLRPARSLDDATRRSATAADRDIAGGALGHSRAGDEGWNALLGASVSSTSAGRDERNRRYQEAAGVTAQGGSS